jgi:CheY-like chemotaxis protein
MTLMLEQAGFQVTTVESGVECLKLAQGDEHFDLYLLDYTFPDVSGVTVCEEIRKSDMKTPILFYSGRAMPQDKEAAMRAGAQAYLIKPGSPVDVAAQVAKWVRASHA